MRYISKIIGLHHSKISMLCKKKKIEQGNLIVLRKPERHN